MYNKVYNPIYILALTGVVIIAGCKEHYDPLNPETSDLPEAAFTLSAVEDRYAPEPYLWTISKNGVTDSVSEEIDDMYVTRYNKLTLAVNGTGAGYKGVNVESSDPKTVQVQELAAGSYALVYVRDGDADITVWNGAKRKSSTKVTFHVKAERAVYPTAAVFIFDEGTEREKEIKCTEWFIDEKQNFESYYKRFTNYHKELDGRDLFKNDGFHIVLLSNEIPNEEVMMLPVTLMHSVRLLRVEPENTSFNYLYAEAKEYNEHLMEKLRPDISPKWAEYLESEGLRSDWGTPWSGYAKDFDKVCYYAKSYYCFDGMTLSLCELTLQSKCPTSSSRCQTALLTHLRLVH